MRYLERFFPIIFLIVLFSTYSMVAVSGELKVVTQFSQVPQNGVVLQGTSTLVMSGTGGTSAATEGEAFICEGDPPTNYECSNSYATYGCSEETRTCYYEEKYEVEKPELGLISR